MKIWHISDTHGSHNQLVIPKDIDIVIHSGDCSNWRDIERNYPEVMEFIKWYSSLPIKHKIYIAGNHDTSIERNVLNVKLEFAKNDIIYLENSITEIEGLKIYGSPITPTFGNWAFMKSRDKTHKIWDLIPEDTDILVTHGPAKGILDLSRSRDNKLEFCGDLALRKRILQIEPKLFLFGHIHNYEDIINAAYTKLSVVDTIFSNGSVVTDGRMGRLSSNGNIFEI